MPHGEVCLKVNKNKGKDAHELLKMLYAWKEQADKLSSEEISREEYDNWRYHYPKFDTTHGEVCLKVNKNKGKDAHELLKMLYAWKEQADKLSSEEISREEYDNWRYHYPKFDTTQRWAKVPSQELSDALVEMFKDQLKPDK